MKILSERELAMQEMLQKVSNNFEALKNRCFLQYLRVQYMEESSLTFSSGTGVPVGVDIL